MISPTLQPARLQLAPAPSHPLPLSLSFHHHHLPHRFNALAVAMAIQKEPGQKGVNWSNIAVGTYDALITTAYIQLNVAVIGAIMNMVCLST